LPPGEVEGELHKELALALYQRGTLSSGKACALAGITALGVGAFETAEKSDGTMRKRTSSMPISHPPYGKILITPAVWKEVVEEGEDQVPERLRRHKPWVEVIAPANKSVIRLLEREIA